MTARKRLRIFAMLAIGLALPDVAAADLTSALRRAISAGAEVADDIPPRALKPAPKQVNINLPDGGRRLNADVAHATIRATDADLLRQIDALAPAERQFALEVFEGGQVLRTVNPDQLARARLVAEGGTDLLVAAQRHGDDVARPAFMIQMAEEVGQMPTGSIARYSQIAVGRGESFVAGWNKYIVPNWKVLAGAGVVSGCLAASEACIDAAGNLTAQMSETFARLGIQAVAGAVSGAAKGAGEAAVEAAKGNDGHWLVAGLGALAFALLVLMRLRILLHRLPQRLFGDAKTSHSTSPKAISPELQTPETTRPRRSLRDRDI